MHSTTRQVNIEIPEAVFNPKYFSAFKNEDRWLLLYGGAGSGKSVFAAQKILIRVMREADHNFLITRKVGRTIRHSSFALFKGIIAEWGLSELFEVGEAEMTITFLPNRNRIISAGLDDVEKLKSIYKITGVWIEEATELSEGDFRQINLRLRGQLKNYKQIIVTFNPIINTAVYNIFFKPGVKHPTNSSILHTTYKDNRFIDEEYRRELEGYADIDAAFHKIYALGEFAKIKGLIYPKFEVIGSDKYPTAYQERFYGLDFGFANPTVLLEVGYQPEYKLYLKQRLYSGGLTNRNLIDAMNAMKIERRVPIYADSAEPARIAEIQEAGYLCLPAEKDVMDGIDFCARFTIYSCEENIETNGEFVTYKRKEDKAGNIIDLPAKLNDHSPDAFRYGTYTHLRNIVGRSRVKAGYSKGTIFGTTKF